MQNPHVFQRLTGILKTLEGVYESGASMSASSKGSEREAFIDKFLSQVLPILYRFGSGDITDSYGRKSGQLDVVIEHPFSPSLPIVGANQNRLYLAESVAAVIEVKSNVANQWDQVCSTADQLAPIRRSIEVQMNLGNSLPSVDQIPLFVASYTGWKNKDTVLEKLNSQPNVSGILIIESGIFVSSGQYNNVQAMGPWSLWGLICCLHNITNSLQSARTQIEKYAVKDA